MGAHIVREKLASGLTFLLHFLNFGLTDSLNRTQLFLGGIRESFNSVDTTVRQLADV